MSFEGKNYSELLVMAVPAVIHSEDEYRRMENMFNDLFDSDRSPDQERLFELLANLLEDYERRTLPALPESSPLDTLKFLMSENNLKQKDLIDVFGSQGIASEVLSGKRSISKIQAKRLEERFNISAAAFI